MNVEEVLKDTLREQAADTGPASPDLADRVLVARRRRRGRTAVTAVLAVTAVVAAAVLVPRALQDDDRAAGVLGTEDVIAHTDQSPPRDAIAAGRSALAAFQTYTKVKLDGGDAELTRTYGVLDPTTKTYRKTTRWSWLTVAPGLRTAAVLEQKLPADRIGILDLATDKVVRWIPVDHKVAAVAFSPDGSKLVATTYEKDPDLWTTVPQESQGGEPGPQASTRTGFYLLDADKGRGKWHGVPADESNGNARQDFLFSQAGNLVFSDAMGSGAYYDLEGRETAVPDNALHFQPYVEQGISPDGTLVIQDGGAVLDARSGKSVDKLSVQTPLAWADDGRVIAWGCDSKKCDEKGEFRNQLLLVTLHSHKTVPLSDFRKASADYPGRWYPQFQTR
ncbi:WD40 repeat domain-containing protein [Streptomyces sp. NPDC059639]|uniref:WD40 repeat domain-containing protein n=1 Tax=Streptomyces sp. NPDC059639 TaxID=3346891 RepID=UPI0036B99380